MSKDNSKQSRQKVRVHNKRLKQSSRQWLERQLNDPYVQQAKVQGYRSRAAFKLVQIQEKYQILRKGSHVVDLGAAPGGWSQVAAAHVGDSGRVIGLDLQAMEPLPGVILLQGDFLEESVVESVRQQLTRVDVVLSDMAPAACGHTATDHVRIMALVQAAADFAAAVLAPGGVFVAKVLRGGTETKLLAVLKQQYQKVTHFKPAASRQDSAEMYAIATGFRGVS
jgi:23S rRNA (uridine2552-2'-O)-methyltransferase